MLKRKNSRSSVTPVAIGNDYNGAMTDEVVHLFAGERFIGEGRTLQLASIALCGAVVAREGDVSTAIESVSCRSCLNDFARIETGSGKQDR